MIARIFLFVVMAIIFVSTTAEGVKGYNDEEFVYWTSIVAMNAIEEAKVTCYAKVGVPGQYHLHIADISQLHCGSMTGTFAYPSPLSGAKFYVEVAGNAPVGATYITSYGVKHTVNFGGGGYLVSEFGGNRFVYSYKDKRFLEANMPVLSATARQILVNQGKGIEITTNELLEALTEYNNICRRIYAKFNHKFSTDSFINALMTSDEERRLFLRYILVRKFYDFAKIPDQYIFWVKNFVMSDFFEMGKIFDTFIRLDFYDNIPVVVVRDIQKKTETITVGSARVMYRMGEEGPMIIESNFLPPQKIQEEIKFFNPLLNFSVQMIRYMKQYTNTQGGKNAK